MNKNYRIHTNIGSDTVLNVKFKQDIDFLEVLTLKISQEDTYRLDNSNYGIIVGRVLANDAFGIPNAKLSVFIELDEDDAEKTDIVNLYNFKTVSDVNSNNVKYNLLPDDKDDDCYRIVGTFPNKRLVLDDNTVLEVFDKYYKYTTVTNNAGDYMIYGVPTGNTTVHVDVDLSDIGVLSQKPRDFMYKGYNEKQFDSAEQFKESTNLDNLSQIISQTQGVYVYPFFGEEGSEDVAITRCDIQVQYKFEPTCVFMGSIVTDSYGNAIGDLCNPSRYVGRNSELVTGFGTIEMIRKTVDGLTEEYQIQGNQLIDGDGVWCYQIPMNLDYVGTDEYGNIVATDNPSKGIPTRTRVRFRVSLTEMENDAISRHRAKYLIPNNPKIKNNADIPTIQDCTSFDKHYNFGSSTQEDDYRDLFWNKVYSVKNYIPRIQNTSKSRTYYYTGLRTSNDYGAKNPVPFNKVRFKIPFSYAFLCLVVKIVIMLVIMINSVIVCPYNMAISIFGIIPFVGRKIVKALSMECISFGTSLTANDEDDVEYYPGCYCGKKFFGACQTPGCTQRAGHFSDLFDIVEQVLAEDYDVVHLDFFNDWLNGCLYAPLWFWKKSKKKSYFFGLFRSSAKNRYCDCDKAQTRLKLMDTCSMNFSGPRSDGGDGWDKNNTTVYLNSGVIKNVTNKDGLNLYYYSPGNIIDSRPTEGSNKKFARLFATDIILLGTFNSCDLDGMPQVYDRLPATTANIPSMKRSVISNTNTESDSVIEGSDEELLTSTIIETGMDWLHDASDSNPSYKNGLLFGIDCTSVETKPKTCINAQRLSELGVSLDATFIENYAPSKGKNEKVEFEADGIVTKFELDDYETRAMFATLNHNGIDVMKKDEHTGYDTYDLRYVYSVDFDGKFSENILKGYKYKNTNDESDEDYLLFKYGPDYEKNIIHNYKEKDPKSKTKNDFFPLYNNSFYFYFGLNEGKTAIDKFRTKFVSKCFQNKKFPFTIDVNKKNRASCIEDVKVDGAVIEVILDDIEKPFSYTLSLSSTNDRIISETNINSNRLMFGVPLDGTKGYKQSDEGKYLSSDGKNYEIDGIIHYFNDKTKVVGVNNDSFVSTSSVTDAWYIENTQYILSLTDANGKTQKETITLMQPPIDVVYSNIELGNAFFPQEHENSTSFSKPEDFYEKETYGEFNISAVTIDGYDYKITGVTDVYLEYETWEIVDGEKKRVIKREEMPYNIDVLQNVSGSSWVSFDLDVYNDVIKKTQNVKLEIGIKNLYFAEDIRNDMFKTIFDCCNTNNFVIINNTNSDDTPTVFSGGTLTEFSGGTPTAFFKDGVMVFHIWVPVTLKLAAIQYCGDEREELEDNMSESFIVISNGKMFDAFINDVPIRFYKNGGNITNNNTDVLKMWFSANTEDGGSYSFPNVGKDESMWSKYINYVSVYDNGVRMCDNDTKFNALIFKFNSIFKTCRSAFFTDNGSNNFSISTVGGKKKIIMQGYYPNYSSFSDFTTIDFNKLQNTSLNRWTLDSIQPNISCDYCHPNVVSNDNYGAYYAYPDKVIDSWRQYYYRFLKEGDFISGTTGFNPLFNTKNNINKNRYLNINYFAAFTNTANKPYNSSPDASVEPWKNKDFEDIPVLPTTSGVYQKWFKTMFIDRRAGYDISIITSTDLPDIEDNVLRNGRIAINIIGGIDMAYQIEENNKENNNNGEGDNNFFDEVESDNYNVISTVEGELEYYYNEDDLKTSNDDIKTHYNKGSNKKYYYEVSVTSDGFEKVDFTKAMMYSGKTINSLSVTCSNLDCHPQIMKNIMNDSRNIAKYNGADFSLDNYPIKRYVDVNNISNLKGFTNIKISSADYPDSVKTQIVQLSANTTESGETIEGYDINESDDNNAVDSGETENTVVDNTKKVLKAYCQETDVNDIRLTCSDIYPMNATSVASCVDTSDFNVLCNYQGGTYYPIGLRVSAKLGMDYIADDTYITYKPFLIYTSKLENLKTILRKIKIDNSETGNIEPADTYKVVENLLKQSNSTLSYKQFTFADTENIRGLVRNYDTKPFLFDEKNMPLNSSDHEDIYKNLNLYLCNWGMKTYSLWATCAAKSGYSNEAYGTNKMDAFPNQFRNKDGLKNMLKENIYLTIFGCRDYVNTDNNVLLSKIIHVFDLSHIYKIGPFGCDISTKAEWWNVTENGSGEDSSLTVNLKVDLIIKPSGFTFGINKDEFDFKVWQTSVNSSGIFFGGSLYSVSDDSVKTKEMVLTNDTDIKSGLTNDFKFTLTAEIIDFENKEQNQTLFFQVFLNNGLTWGFSFIIDFTIKNDNNKKKVTQTQIRHQNPTENS